MYVHVWVSLFDSPRRAQIRYKVTLDPLRLVVSRCVPQALGYVARIDLKTLGPAVEFGPKRGALDPQQP